MKFTGILAVLSFALFQAVVASSVDRWPFIWVKTYRAMKEQPSLALALKSVISNNHFSLNEENELWAKFEESPIEKDPKEWKQYISEVAKVAKNHVHKSVADTEVIILDALQKTYRETQNRVKKDHVRTQPAHRIPSRNAVNARTTPQLQNILTGSSIPKGATRVFPTSQGRQPQNSKSRRPTSKSATNKKSPSANATNVMTTPPRLFRQTKRLDLSRRNSVVRKSQVKNGSRTGKSRNQVPRTTTLRSIGKGRHKSRTPSGPKNEHFGSLPGARASGAARRSFSIPPTLEEPEGGRRLMERLNRGNAAKQRFERRRRRRLIERLHRRMM